MRYLLLITLLLPFGVASAALHSYGASEHESRWESASSRLYCSLSHEIPYYGKAVFEAEAGAELAMKLQVKAQPLQGGSARLLSSAPQWQHQRRGNDLGEVDYKRSRTPITLEQATARRLLLELEQGMFPSFYYQDWVDGGDQVQVSLSAVNFRAAMGEFVDCLAVLLPYSFDYVQQSKLYFAFAKHELSDEAKKRLDEVAEYLLGDEAVKLVAVYGRTDNRGFRHYNDALGQRRAEAVRDYLLAKGVDGDRLQIMLKSYGERKPVASNRSKKGRALNRVVEVTLSK